MDTDSNLLNLNNGRQASAAKAGALNEARNSGDSLEGGNDDEGDSSSTWSRVRGLIRKQNEKESKASAITAAATSPISKGTSKLLQQAWLNLIDSYGLTLIWINIHVWLGTIFGHQFFGKLGAEWMDNNIMTAEADKAKSQGTMLGVVEPMTLFALDAIALLLIAFVGGVLYFIATATWFDIFKALWSSLGLWGSLK